MKNVGKIIKALYDFLTDTNNGVCEDKDCENCPFPACGKETAERGQKESDKNIKQPV